MIQGGSGSGLAPETIQRAWVASEFIRQELESDKSLQPAVLRLINDAHPAAAQLLDDAVMGDGPADQQIGALLPASHGPRGNFQRRILQKSSHLLVGRQQRTDLTLQHLVAYARVPQKRVALSGLTVQHRLQYV